MTAAPATAGLGLAVLTGVARRGQVGEVVARILGEAGYALALIARDAGDADARAGELRASGLAATGYGCDLTDADALGEVAAAIAAEHPRGARALVCLAGGFGGAPSVADTAPALFQRQVAINLTTAFLTTRAFLPMVRSARGSIVYFASAAAMAGENPAGMAAYASAKAGVATLMRAVAREERAHGVRANALAPTMVRTGDNVAAMGDAKAYVERETVAWWVRHLCAAEAGPISGQLIRLG